MEARFEAGQAAVRELADHLRHQGVVVVAGRALAAARPEGLDLISSLPVLVAQIAEEWCEASEQLPTLDLDRLQVRSAATLLAQAGAAAAGDGVPIDSVHNGQLARAVALRTAITTAASEPELLDRIWVVLHDLRRMVRGADSAEDLDAVALVPSATAADPDLARDLPPALNRAACAGALVGLLAPWLPAPTVEGAAKVDALLHAVSGMARAPHDDARREALSTVGRVVASLSVAAAYSSSGILLNDAQALSYTFSEPALRVLLEQATQVALTAGGDLEALSVDRDVTVDAAPVPSPSQQARAAAERAAAERRATQQAFMDRAAALRASTRRVAETASTPTAIPIQQGTAVGSPSLPEEAAAGDNRPLAVPTPTVNVDLTDSATRGTIPPLADVQAELGEDDVSERALWDTLMRPR